MHLNLQIQLKLDMFTQMLANVRVRLQLVEESPDQLDPPPLA